jgi:hypothetical protein
MLVCTQSTCLCSAEGAEQCTEHMLLNQALLKPRETFQGCTLKSVVSGLV